MWKCPGCKSESLLTRKVGVLFLLCPQCQESWRMTQAPQTAQNNIGDLEALVDTTRALVRRARASWQALLDLSLELSIAPPTRLPLTAGLPGRIEQALGPARPRLWKD